MFSGGERGRWPDPVPDVRHLRPDTGAPSAVVGRKEGLVFSRAVGRLGAIGIVLSLVACTAIPEPGSPGTVAVEQLPSLDAVPPHWGTLVSTNPIPSARATALWFRDDSGTIRMVAFDHETSQLWPQARVIHRR